MALCSVDECDASSGDKFPLMGVINPEISGSAR